VSEEDQKESGKWRRAVKVDVAHRPATEKYRALSTSLVAIISYPSVRGPQRGAKDREEGEKAEKGSRNSLMQAANVRQSQVLLNGTVDTPFKQSAKAKVKGPEGLHQKRAGRATSLTLKSGSQLLKFYVKKETRGKGERELWAIVQCSLMTRHYVSL